LKCGRKEGAGVRSCTVNSSLYLRVVLRICPAFSVLRWRSQYGLRNDEKSFSSAIHGAEPKKGDPRTQTDSCPHSQKAFNFEKVSGSHPSILRKEQLASILFPTTRMCGSFLQFTLTLCLEWFPNSNSLEVCPLSHVRRHGPSTILVYATERQAGTCRGHKRQTDENQFPRVSLGSFEQVDRG
jgi:hypothetical protein